MLAVLPSSPVSLQALLPIVPLLSWQASTPMQEPFLTEGAICKQAVFPLARAGATARVGPAARTAEAGVVAIVRRRMQVTVPMQEPVPGDTAEKQASVPLQEPCRRPRCGLAGLLPGEEWVPGPRCCPGSGPTPTGAVFDVPAIVVAVSTRCRRGCESARRCQGSSPVARFVPTSRLLPVQASIPIQDPAHDCARRRGSLHNSSDPAGYQSTRCEILTFSYNGQIGTAINTMEQNQAKVRSWLLGGL